MIAMAKRGGWSRRTGSARVGAKAPRGSRSRGSARRIAVLGLILILGAAAFAQPDVTAADVTRVQEVERLLEQYGDATWRGWGPQPILLRTAERELLFAHPAPPPEFEPVALPGAEGLHAHAAEGYVTPGPIATAWPVGDAWAVAIPTLDIFQATIDEFLGEGVVSLDGPTYVRARVHEAFHAFQLTTVGGPERLWPADQVVDEREVMAALQSLDDLDAWHARQGRALVAALEADRPADVAREARRFLTLRRAWRAAAPEGTRKLERQIEWAEGLARYADVHVMMSIETCRPGAPTIAAGASVFRYPEPADVWAEFVSQVEDPATMPGSIRDRYYVLGAAQAFLLDALMPGWHERALPGRTALEDLLGEAVGD